MTINVNKPFFSFRLKYDILVDGVQEFIAKADIIHLPYKPQLSLYDLSKNKILYIKLASPFYMEYDLIFTNGERIELRLEENTREIYSFHHQGYKYIVHFNNDGSASIFKGNEKVADFIKEQKFEDFIIRCYNDNYKIIVIAITLSYCFTLNKATGHRLRS
ncbi:hypothetical protein [Emticicia fontis]